MSTTHVRLTYDGLALAGHTMDVRSLAPALLAFGDLCEETGKLLFGQDVDTRVEVKASFRSGSFGIDLSVAPQLVQQVIQWLSGNDATAVSNGAAIVGAIGTFGGGLIAVLRWLKNRRIKRVEVVPDGRRIITEDDDSIVVEERIIFLLQSRTVRTSLQQVVRPIESDGIDTVAFGTDEHVETVIARPEAAWFHVPPPEDALLADDTRMMSFSIVSVSFKEDNKWRLSDGQNSLYVTMADNEFLDRVNRNLERFAKGDILKAETRISQWQTTEGLKTEYTILRVIEHRPGVPQIHLPI
ncbi:MAG: hypothetical protein M0T84_15630 [Betaproteobacteria bacterium]|nr:hypothetical protein [Betaproteobacteria bacterium]